MVYNKNENGRIDLRSINNSDDERFSFQSAPCEVNKTLMSLIMLLVSIGGAYFLGSGSVLILGLLITFALYVEG